MVQRYRSSTRWPPDLDPVEAKVGCPVSKALAATPISLDAKLLA